MFPLDPRFSERMDPKLRVAGEPPTSWTYYGNNVWLPEPIGPQLFPRGHTITAELTIPKGGAEGVITCAGGVLGRLVAVREGRQADLPLHVLRHRRRHHPRHGRAAGGQGDAQDRVHAGRVEGRRRHAQAVRQRQARRRGQAQAVGVPPRARTVRGRPRLDHADRPGLQGQRAVRVHRHDREGRRSTCNKRRRKSDHQRRTR